MTTVVRYEFALRLRSLMDKRNLSGSELAKLTGLTRETIYRYLVCKHTPGLEEIALLCKALGITASELVGF